MSRLIQTTTIASQTLSMRDETEAKEGKIILTCIEQGTFVFFLQNNRLLAMNRIPDSAYSVGSIYLARIRNIKQEMKGCFLDLAENETAFMKLSDLPEGVHQGDVLPVQIVAEAQRGKRIRVTGKFSWKKIPNGEELKAFAPHRTAYSCLYKKECPIVDILRLTARFEEYTELLTDQKDIYAYMLSDTSLPDTIQVRFYEDATYPLAKLYSLKTKVEEALARQVWLKSGSFLVIEQTEACVVIDVNSGKKQISDKADTSQSIFHLNLEAAKEIALQLRLRNLSGMILIDFINMNNPELDSLLLKEMTEYVSGDKSPVIVHDMTALGIMELTRKKTTMSLKEQMYNYSQNASLTNS